MFRNVRYHVATRGCRSIPRATQGHNCTGWPGEKGPPASRGDGRPRPHKFSDPSDKILSRCYLPFIHLCFIHYSRYSRYSLSVFVSPCISPQYWESHRWDLDRRRYLLFTGDVEIALPRSNKTSDACFSDVSQTSTLYESRLFFLSLDKRYFLCLFCRFGR